MGRRNASERRIPIVLACTVCKARNYKTSRSRQPNAKAVTLKKYCAACGAHTLHLETQ
jgi:large subunit ribosomal protein L33